MPVPEQSLARAGEASQLVMDRAGAPIMWHVNYRDEWRFPIHLDEVPEHLIAATLAAEDKRFFQHFGVDPSAALRAAYQNLVCGRRTSGASTLSMQCVRMMIPRPRSIFSKLIESLQAIGLERKLGKRGVLELYFNLAPYGGNHMGIGAASWGFFSKPPSKLTLAESALLAGVPQGPTRFNPMTNKGASLRRRNYVLNRMSDLGLYSKEVTDLAARVPIRISRPSLLASGYAIANLFPERGLTQSTLDLEVQATLETVLRERCRDFMAMGVEGIGALVLDVESSELLGVAGSYPGKAQLSNNWFNTTTAYRQPGSLLKPFLYAYAFTQGWIFPEGPVDDSPGNWMGYSPNNSDMLFRGRITVSEALRDSRNLPAVKLLQTVGVPTFRKLLDRLGINLKHHGRDTGLSLALGTDESRLIDMAAAYACLARLGTMKELKWIRGKEQPGNRVLHPGAAWMTLKALGASDAHLSFTPAAKTGTSWNNRDAWALVMSPKYVVGIWCGKLSGQGHGNLSGAESALPLAQDLLMKVHGKSNIENWPRPSSISTVRICSSSGLRASSQCAQITLSDAIKGLSPEAPCRGTCRSLPQELSNYYSEIPVRDDAIKILSPKNGGIYLLDEESGIRYLNLSAKLGTSSRCTWFLDGKVLSKNPNHRWTMIPGSHLLSIVDSRGKHQKIHFFVRSLGS
ncbi:MAG: penicillin-binding protein 1C [Planctomycetes bacterium]|nr:penicillin-binding protein 1C [Planctomycetota bacterium]